MTQTISKFRIKYNNLSEPAKASLWYVFCNVLNKSIALLSTPIFTRVMTEEQYGTFVNFQAWYNILLIFTSLNIFLGGYQKGLITWKEDVDRFSSACMGLMVTITCGFGLVYLVAPDFWSTLLDLPPIFMLPMFLELLFMPALDLWATRKRFDYKYRKYVAISLGMNACCMLFGVLAVLGTDYKAEARVYSDVFSKMMFCVPLFALIFWKGKTFFNKTWWTYSLNFNLPLIPHYLSNYVLSQSDRLMIASMVSKAAAALYSVAYQISTMMTLITTAINNSLTPFIYQHLEKEDVEPIRSSCKPLVLLLAVLTILVMLFAPEVIAIFASHKYAPAIYVIPPVSASVFFIFIYNLYSNVEYYYEKTKLITAATLCAALLNLVLNFIFIPIFSFYAAGYTTLVSYIVLAFMHFVFYRRVMHEFLPNEKDVFDLKNILGCSALVLVSMVVIALTYPVPLLRYALIVVLLVMLFFKRQEVIRIVRSVIKR